MKRFRSIGWASLASALISSCSGDPDTPKKQPPQAANNPFSAYAIHVFGEQAPGTEVELAFPPVEAVSNPTSAGATVSGPGSKPSALVETDGGMENTDKDVEPGWLLLMRAAHDCSAKENLRSFVSGITAPWADLPGHDGWYLFAGELDDPGAFARFNSCEKVVALEHILLCTADKLQEVAETVSPVVWPVVSSVSYVLPNGVTIPPYMNWQWTIPPQSSKDKFIIRDLALNVLANLARLDLEAPYSTGVAAPNLPLPAGDTCADAWAKSADTGSSTYFDDSKTTIYSSTPIDLNLPITQANREELAEIRFRQNTQILRTAGRMARTLIQDSVIADLAGAEQQRGRAADTERGAALLWGAETDSTAPYNSLTHAFRIVFGRWESNRLASWAAAPSAGTEARVPSGDPACGGLGPMQLLAGSSPAISARWADKRTAKVEQEFASRMIDRSGIVVPTSELENDVGAVKTAVKNQLVLNAAKGAGFASVADPKFANRKLSIETMINDIDDADFRFAMDRNLGAYRLLTGAPESTPVPATDGAGVKLLPSGDIDGSVTGINGTVLHNGMVRADVIGDTFARTALGFTASQCSEVQPVSVPDGSANAGKTAAFQDAFMIGETFRRRLSQVRTLTESSTFPQTSSVGDTMVPDLADRASAELRSWTGPGLAMFRFSSERTLEVRISGMAPADLGVTTPAQMKTRIRAVWGKPWVADCATGTRRSCPPNFKTDYLRPASVEFVDSEVPGYASYTGSDGRVLSLEFDLDQGPAQFVPTATPAGTAPANLLYLIAAGDPRNPVRGKVLTSLAYRAVTSEWSFAPISDFQKKLANDFFGVADDWMSDGGKLGTPPTTSPPSYCIKGVPRDFFVPLENELTSDSDSFESSWRHYLEAAKESAAITDTFGQQLIDIGLQTDMRKEAAQKELGKICGDFSAGQKVVVEKGLVKNTTDDSALNSCLNEDTYDVVFLTSLPPDGQMSDAQIRTEYLGCESEDERPVCESALPLDKAGLGIVPWYDPKNSTPAPVEDSCGAALALSASTTSSAGFAGNKVQTVMDLEKIDEDAMGALLGALRIEMDEELHWTAKLDNTLIMSTKTADSGLWPVCNASCTPQPPPAIASPGELQAEKLRRIFGSFNTTDVGKRNEAFERVAGTLWLMAATSGQLPPQLFTLPIPARNDFTAPDIEAAPILYTKAKFNENPPGSGNYFIDLTPDPTFGPLSGDDKDIMGVAHPITAAFANAVGASAVRPDWVKGVYQAAAASASSNPPKFLHVMASNEARLFPQEDVMDPVPWLIQQGLRLSGAKETAGSCNPDTGEVSAAKVALRQRKYPDDSVPVMCAAPSGIPLLLLRDSEGVVNDVAQYHVDGTRTITETIPMRQSGKKVFPLSNHTWYAGQSGACFHTRIGANQVPFVAASCLKDEDDLPEYTPHTRFTRSLLSATACPPSGRAQAFIDWSSVYPNGCRAAREFAASLALTCVLGRAYRSIGIGDPLPSLTKPEDIGKLTNWLEDQKKNVRVSLSRLHLVGVPKRIIAEKEAGQVGVGAYKGDHGLLVLQYRGHLQTFSTKWLAMEGNFAGIGSAIASAQNSLVIQQLVNDEALANLAMEEIQLHATIAKGFVAMAAGVAQMANVTYPDQVEGAASIAQGAIDVAAARKQLGVLQKLKNITAGKNATGILQIMLDLKAQTEPAYTGLQTDIEEMQTAVAEAHQISNQLAQKENEAKYEAAQASAAGYYIDSDGNTVDLPVNTVQRRLYDITKRRYEASLENSKYLAYMARLAIEQRIGMRLEEMGAPVGSLDAPSLWANDVCSFSGVNYEALRKETKPDAGGIGGIFTAIGELYYLKYADPFIGDYVQKLENFVEFYNIEYPAHEGDDVAVLSIRDDLLGPGGQCYRPSRNLLFHSHDLTQTGVAANEGSEPPNGWIRNACEVQDPYCLAVAPGDILKKDGTPLPAPGVAPSEGFTWLHETAFVSVPGTEPDPPVSPKPPSRAVYQKVELGVTPYALSWHDMARGTLPDETPPSASQEYTVGVYGPNWDLITSFTGLPHVYSTTEPWSERNVLAFTPTTNGKHYVVFSASVKGATTPGSVAIANVQLEQAPSTQAVSGYEATGSSKLILSGNCIARDPSQFRSAFEYLCDAQHCYYQLKQQFAISIPALLAGNSTLAGKVAQGNFNYRHLTAALNVVGTGVVDCTKSPTPSCFGSPYVEYIFEHDAFDAHLIDYWGEGRPFDFGSAGIFFGKALAAERFVTLPMGSADQAFFSQPEFEKVEFNGRPLDGSYRLRIYDNPALNWTQVEDIQFILNYRYWSRVTRSTRK